MSSRALKVIILGAGFMGSVHASSYKNIPGVELLGFVDKNQEKARALADKFGTETWTELEDEVLANSDFVDICLPTWMHRPMAEKAFSAGKDVICEKPIALEPEDAEAIVKAAEDSGRKFMVAHVVRFWPEYTELKRLLEDKEIAEPQQLTFSRYGPAPAWSEGNWMLRDDKSGGIVFDLTIHDIDLCIWLFGMPKWVFARKSCLGGIYTTYVNAVLGYDNCNVLLESGFIYKSSYPFTTGFRLAAGDASYEYINKSKQGLIKYAQDKEAEKLNYPDWDPYQKELEYFTDCIRKDQKPGICTGKDALLAIRLARAITKSAENEMKLEVSKDGKISI